jgi:hypothetical protein
MEYLGWVASIVKLLGWWEIGCKKQRGLTLYIIGTLLWCYIAVDRIMWDLLLLEAVTVFVLARNWVKWYTAKS